MDEVKKDREIGFLKQENERLLRGDTEVKTGNKRPSLYGPASPARLCPVWWEGIGINEDSSVM